MLDISRPKHQRYVITKTLTDFLFGPSPIFQTLLELNLIGHLFRPFGFRTPTKHLCQALVANKVQHFDYGLIGNKQRYGTIWPPAYDLSKMRCENWMLVAAENDPFCRLDDVRKLIATTPKKPFRHIYLKNSNHLDTVGLVDIDIKVNLPISEFMDAFPLNDR